MKQGAFCQDSHKAWLRKSLFALLAASVSYAIGEAACSGSGTNDTNRQVSNSLLEHWSS